LKAKSEAALRAYLGAQLAAGSARDKYAKRYNPSSGRCSPFGSKQPLDWMFRKKKYANEASHFRHGELEVVAARALLQGDDQVAHAVEVPADRVLHHARALQLL